MKRIITIVVSGIVTAAMAVSLTGCTMDIHTESGHYHIDTKDIAKNIGLDEDDIDNILAALSIDTDSLEEAFQDFLDELQDYREEAVENIVDDIEDIGNNVEAIIGEIDEATDIEVESEDSYDYDEILAELKDAMEANGLGEYYDLIIYELENNPDELMSILESGSLEDIMMLFLMSNYVDEDTQTESSSDGEEDTQAGTAFNNYLTN